MSGTGLDVLVAGLFDYAGMFPPAALSFDDALRESAGLPHTLRRPDMIGADMVLTPEDLQRLDDDALRAAGYPEGRNCRIAVVGLRAGPGLLEDVQALRDRDRERAGDRAPQKIHAVEASLPADADPRAMQASLQEARDVLRSQRIRLYLEPRWTADAWADRGDAFLASVLDLHDGSLGLKLRCDGPTAVDAATLARAIGWACEHGVPLKATQGLHHPLREPRRYGNLHGFLNTAAALRLCQGGAIRADQVLRVLEEDDADAYGFADGLSWRGAGIGEDDLETAVRRLPFSIGSCSAREPDDDLVRLFGG